MQFTSQVRLVIFDSVLDHIVRMDRVLRHSLRRSAYLKWKGHGITLVGAGSPLGTSCSWEHRVLARRPPA